MTNLRYTAKRNIVGDLLYVFSLRINDRWMTLEDVPSRALGHGEIHELVLSENEGLRPGKGVRDTVYIGFFEWTDFIDYLRIHRL